MGTRPHEKRFVRDAARAIVRTLLCLVALSMLMPLAAAEDPSVCAGEEGQRACAGHFELGDPSCTTSGEYVYGFEGQQVLVEAADVRAWVMAHEACTAYDGWRLDASGVHGEATYRGWGLGAQWVEGHNEQVVACGLSLIFIEPGFYTFVILPCPASPPNPGWGQLLP